MSALVETKGLRAGYGSVEVVRGIDLSVEPGEVVAVLGPNGAGKTTTLLTLSGELAPLGGELEVLGCRGSTPLHLLARQGLALVTQERAVLMTLTAEENLRVSRCDVGRAIELFPELEAHLGRRVGLLSGGQQQMLALARGLARGPRLLLVDELSLGLAPLIVERLLGVVRAAADDGVGVLLVEQHVHQAMEVADRVLVMRRGTIALAGRADQLRDRADDIRDAYLSTNDTGGNNGDDPTPATIAH
ncbi:MAG TPA: ATP-binding cassette domain-containing protein [Microthrixaceae bacterium]|nr:ATP-binding cassette domain-containing protein [Microthrixaceae bacterium]